MSFEETFDAELANELGDLGPASEKRNDEAAATAVAAAVTADHAHLITIRARHDS